MGIHDNTRFAVCQADYHVGRFPAYSFYGCKGVYVIGNLSSESFEKLPGDVLYALCLITVEPRGPYVLFQFCLRRIQVVFHRSVLLKESFCHGVDPFVGALGRQDRRNNEFEGVRIGKLHPGLAVHFLKFAQNGSDIFFHVRIQNNRMYHLYHLGRRVSKGKETLAPLEPLEPLEPPKNLKKPRGRTSYPSVLFQRF